MPELFRVYKGTGRSCQRKSSRNTSRRKHHAEEDTGAMKRQVISIIALICTAMFFVCCDAESENVPAGKTIEVELTTTLGSLTIELYPEKAPITVENFFAYIDAGFYDGTIFHRVIPRFMIQGGGLTGNMKEKETRSPIKNEAMNGLKNIRGTLAMARTRDVNSATSQFFINLKHNEFLDHGVRDYGYAVFGKVVQGMDVVDKIAAVKTGNRGMHQNVPVDAVVIESLRRK